MSERAPSLLDLAAARLRPARRDVAVALLVLGATPVITALAIHAATWTTERRVARIAAEHAPAFTAARAAEARSRRQAAVAPLFAAPTVSAVAARLAAVLPDDARVQLLEVTDATLRAEIECVDPDALIRALARDPLLRRLRREGQRPAAGEGVRVVLAEPAP